MRIESNLRPPARVLAATLVAALLVLTAGCSKSSDKNLPTSKLGSQSAPIAQTSSDEFNYDDPCSLLEPKEVEAVLGAPLAVPPYRWAGAAPVKTGDDCVYETADFHRILFHVDFTGGAQAYNISNFAGKLLGGHPDAAMKKAFRLENGTEITGEWDEARLMAMNCCIFVTMRGDQAIQIEFTGSDATLQQAADLVNAAYKRIDKPLKVDGAAGVEAAKTLAKSRPAQVEACALLPRAEAEAILGKLTADPTGKGDSCTYSVPDAKFPGNARQYEVSIRWRGGYQEFRSQPYVAGIAMNAMVVGVKEVAPGPGAKMEQDVAAAQKQKPAEESGPWLHAGNGGRGFMAVKKDVLVQVNAFAADPADMRKLAAAVMSKI